MSQRKRTLSRFLPVLAAVLLAVAAAAFAMYVALSPAYRPPELSPDEGNYIATARRMLNEHRYSFWDQGPDAYVSPGYPVFLMLCFALFGSEEGGLTAVRLIQCLLQGGTVFLTFLVGRAITRRSGVGVYAAVVLTCCTGYCVYTRMMLTEPLYYFLMMLSFFLLLRAERKEDSRLRFGLAGLVFGAAVMVRSLVVVMLPFLLLPRLLRRKQDRKTAMVPALAFLIGFLIPCLPWWARNLVTLHRLVLFATQTNPIYAGLAQNVEERGIVDPGSYLGNFRILFRLMREDPVGTLSWMTLGKFRVMFIGHVVVLETVSDIARNLAIYTGLAGALGALINRRTRLLALPFWIYFICIFFSVPEVRYSYQYLPLLAVFSGWTLSLAWERLRAADRPK